MEHRKLNRALSGLDEKHARRVLGLMAEKEGHGGIARLSRITGMSRTTIRQGQRELVGEDPVPEGRIRRQGAGRKLLEKKRPELTIRLNQVMEDATAGDPMSSVKWTRRSARSVGRALRVSPTKAYRMLRANKYRLRFNRKRLTRKSPDHRDQQFRIINGLKSSFARQGQPIISVDAKKRELVGLFKNSGRAWRKEPKDVGVYDFLSDAEGVAIPYGIYDVTGGDGFVVVGTSHNTPEFATNAVQTWWNSAGHKAHTEAKELLILADSGSSNSARAHQWKAGLQRIADDTGLKIRVAHYPTGASKWNPVEHRLFGPISNNWAGQPLTDYPTVCNFIRNTRTTSGRRCKVVLDRHTWLTQKEKAAAGIAIVIPKQAVAIKHGRNLPHLNYTIVPQASRRS